ncbi:hypothetical protein [Desulfoluna spongiiphila]|uniref:Uncharacterized protein n=1 Tax=Desulfoluna spongiiphila TaxID=419481 RepID=A0A1G5HDB3_9BACT|nr:hypothetical protein [Desulfoluna spongiiphila]SCY60988.1 hypothetical protein SAMN05216233_11364 [Desulfoluna spongiiphila]VVS94596.1 hypothetical protein DBB_41680 [Desulfoluna spongiiphila]
MGKVFRTNNKESMLLSRIESSKEKERRVSIETARDNLEPMSNAISQKLVENSLVETTSKNSLQDQIEKKLEKLVKLDDFEIDYQIAPFRELVQNPNVISLVVTAFVLETLIDHKDVIDIYGSDDEIYNCINTQVQKFMPPM